MQDSNNQSVRYDGSLDWFDIRKYDCMASASLIEWRAALMVRRYLRFLVDLIKFPADEQANESFDDVFFEATSEIKPRPGRRYMSAFLADEETDQLISPVLYCNLAHTWRSINKQSLTEGLSEYAVQGNLPQDEQLLSRYKKIQSMPLDELWDDDDISVALHKSAYATVMLDVRLGAPKDLLVRQFSELVDSYKSKFEIADGKKLSRKTTSSWQRNAVLPYLDLTLYLQRHGISKTDQEIGIMLFPGEFDKSLDQKIRRTVRRTAEILMSVSILTVFDMSTDKANALKNIEDGSKTS